MKKESLIRFDENFEHSDTGRNFVAPTGDIINPAEIYVDYAA